MQTGYVVLVLLVVLTVSYAAQISEDEIRQLFEANSLDRTYLVIR